MKVENEPDSAKCCSSLRDRGFCFVNDTDRVPRRFTGRCLGGGATDLANVAEQMEGGREVMGKK